MWAGPQTAIHTHSKPPCDCVFHMPSRSPHITVCITMIHSQPTCDCAGNAENFDLLCFSRSIFIYNLHYYQVQLRPTNSPLENGKRVEHRGQQDTFFQCRARMRISPIQSWTSRRDKNFWHSIHASRRDREKFPSILGNETRLRFIIFDQRLRDENEN